jgi:GNAT superfamily N-acetyltransferase
VTVLATRPVGYPPPGAPGSARPLAEKDAPASGWLLVRSALPADGDALVAMHDRCSLETRIARWHAPIRGIPASYLTEVTAGAATHAAVVAARTTVPGELMGLASACMVSPDVWELGMLVEDAWQRQGVGRAMLRMLVVDVLRRGARDLLAVSLDERRSVLRNLHELGPVTFSAEFTTVTARVQLGQ